MGCFPSLCWFSGTAICIMYNVVSLARHFSVSNLYLAHYYHLIQFMPWTVSFHAIEMSVHRLSTELKDTCELDSEFSDFRFKAQAFVKSTSNTYPWIWTSELESVALNLDRLMRSTTTSRPNDENGLFILPCIQWSRWLSLLGQLIFPKESFSFAHQQ